ncbi:hypothetical protein [Streptomyces sp. NPDC000134]|uniref:hypothetical protein n=1 Tax=Streptomyces sp. NPDC000134 TaxID=3364536 RepID=UPI0036CDC760
MLTLEVDADAWKTEYGVDKADVREDVKGYIGNAIGGSHLVDDQLITEVRWR